MVLDWVLGHIYLNGSHTWGLVILVKLRLGGYKGEMFDDNKKLPEAMPFWW